ncbi:MAG: addiction module antidote protein [Candidatus Acidiferrales bacterium]
MNREENFKADLLEELRSDPEYAAEYLSAAKADSNEAFLVALRDVAEAQKGMKKVAKAAGVNRENLYRALSKKGNPRIDTLDAVLDVLGIEFKFVPKRVPRVVSRDTAKSGSEHRTTGARRRDDGS